MATGLSETGTEGPLFENAGPSNPRAFLPDQLVVHHTRIFEVFKTLDRIFSPRLDVQKLSLSLLPHIIWGGAVSLILAQNRSEHENPNGKGETIIANLGPDRAPE